MNKLLTLLFVGLSMSAFAQTKITVKEEINTIDGEERNSLTVLIEDANTDDVTKAWKKQLKDLKGKVDDKTVIFGDDCKDKSMGENTFDVYSVVESSFDTAVKLIVAFDLGGAYLTSADHPEKYLAARAIVRGFAVEQSKQVVQVAIEATQKTLKDLEKDLGKLKKDKEKSEKDIADYEGKIQANKGSIDVNVSAQKAKHNEVHKLEQGQIESHSEEVAKVIKSYEKELAGMAKDKTKLEKDNVALTEKIKEARKEIAENEKNQDAKNAEIEAVKRTIKELEVKLKSIN